MQQDAHEFLNHLLNTCADILLGLLISFFVFILSSSIFVFLLSCIAEKKEEKEKYDKQRNKSNSVAVSNNYAPLNDDGQYIRISFNMNMNGDMNFDNSLVEDTWIHELFQGILVSTTKCLNCETVCEQKS